VEVAPGTYTLRARYIGYAPGARRAQMVWIETSSNPLLRITDLRRVSSPSMSNEAR